MFTECRGEKNVYNIEMLRLKLIKDHNPTLSSIQFDIRENNVSCVETKHHKSRNMYLPFALLVVLRRSNSRAF